jgi:hypothetical protein
MWGESQSNLVSCPAPNLRTSILWVRDWSQPRYPIWPGLEEIRLCYYLLLNFILCLYGNRAGPPKRDPTWTDPRSRVTGLGIFHINAITWAGSPIRGQRAECSRQISIVKGLCERFCGLITVKIACENANFRSVRKFVVLFY